MLQMHGKKAIKETCIRRDPKPFPDIGRYLRPSGRRLASYIR